MRACPQCHSLNRLSARFCLRCGARLGVTPAAPEAAPPEGPIEIAPPLSIDALRLQNVRLALRDAHVAPAFEAVVGLNVYLSNLGSAVRPVRFGFDVHAEPFLDVLRVEGSGRVDRDVLKAEFSAALGGFRAGALNAYLSALGI